MRRTNRKDESEEFSVMGLLEGQFPQKDLRRGVGWEERAKGFTDRNLRDREEMFLHHLNISFPTNVGFPFSSV